jgi:hypothetical protein
MPQLFIYIYIYIYMNYKVLHDVPPAMSVLDCDVLCCISGIKMVCTIMICYYCGLTHFPRGVNIWKISFSSSSRYLVVSVSSISLTLHRLVDSKMGHGKCYKWQLIYLILFRKTFTQNPRQHNMLPMWP